MNASHTIVVADDHRDNAETLSLLLRIAGHDVHHAFDGLHAVQLIRDVRPRVAIVDISMPGLDGYGVARAVADLPHRRSLLLIALSGWGPAEFRERALAAGFDEFYLKPIEPDVLHARIDALLRAEGAESC